MKVEWESGKILKSSFVQNSSSIIFIDKQKSGEGRKGVVHFLVKTKK